mgnify:FL=1
MATVPDRACRARLRRLWRWYTGDIVPPQSADINNHTRIGGLEAQHVLANGISGTSNHALRATLESLAGRHGNRPQTSMKDLGVASEREQS